MCLKCVTLVGEGIKNDYMLKLVKGLPNLTELNFDSAELTFTDLKNILRFADNLTSLSLHKTDGLLLNSKKYEALVEILKKSENQIRRLTINLPLSSVGDIVGSFGYFSENLEIIGNFE